MELNKSNFYQTLEAFVSIPEKICSVSEEAFLNVYESDEARNTKNIVYLWLCVKKFNG